MPATFAGDDMFPCLSLCGCTCHCDLGSVSAGVNDSGIVGQGDGGIDGVGVFTICGKM